MLHVLSPKLASVEI